DDASVEPLIPQLPRCRPAGLAGTDDHERRYRAHVQLARATDRVRFAGLAVVGVLAGFLSGLFGVGGGILIVPGLVLVLKMEQRLAHGTSLGAILPISVAGVIGYAIDRSGDRPSGALLTAGAVV